MLCSQIDIDIRKFSDNVNTKFEKEKNLESANNINHCVLKSQE